MSNDLEAKARIKINKLLEEAGWNEGDILDWSDNGNGSWTLKKVEEVTPEEEEAWKELERKNNI